MLSVSIFVLIGAVTALPEPARTVALNVVQATVAAGTVAYASNRPLPAGTLGGPVGIRPTPP